jgi:hypothetical protein
MRALNLDERLPRIGRAASTVVVSKRSMLRSRTGRSGPSSLRIAGVAAGRPA